MRNSLVITVILQGAFTFENTGPNATSGLVAKKRTSDYAYSYRFHSAVEAFSDRGLQLERAMFLETDLYNRLRWTYL